VKSNQAKIREIVVRLLQAKTNTRNTSVVQLDAIAYLNVMFALSEIAESLESETTIHGNTEIQLRNTGG
jgi:hypothetical protein